jgi:N utilization substance protein A
MEVIVPDDQLSLAIGKKGQNVRLAAKLTGWKIDIRTESDSKGGKDKLTPDEALRIEMQAAGEREAKERAAAIAEICDSLSVTEEVASALIGAGFSHSESLSEITREELEQIEELDEQGVNSVLAGVAARLEKGNA